MRVGSVCSGIEAASVAWKPLGWDAVWYSEIEPFCCAVLQHHYPDTPNLGDITKITESDLERHGPIDILVGGTPCQSFSVAGLRKGMADPRGNLALRFLQLAGATRPPWVLWENVPGVLSSDKGRDFASVLGGLEELGYGWAYRVLDAQYFGVPQRRRRVFVVGYLGDWRRAAAVLFERESLCGYPPPSRETGAGVAGKPAACLNSGGNEGGFRTEPGEHVVVSTLDANYGKLQGCSGQDANHGHSHLIPFDTTQVTSPDNYSSPKPGDACHPLAEGQHPPAVAYRDDRGRGNDNAAEDVTFPLHAAKGPSEQQVVAFCTKESGADAGEVAPPLRGESGDPHMGGRTAVAYQCHGSNVGEMGHLRAGNGNESGGVPFVESSMAVRRLTPVECSRLQGFSGDYLTQVTYRGKCPPADGPMYRALGNSMCTNVMFWLGQRIMEATEAGGC